IRHMVAEGDDGGLVFASFRLALVTPTSAVDLRLRLRFRIGRFGMALPRLGLRLLARAFLGLSVSIPPLPLLVALRLGMRLLAGTTAAAPMSAFAGLEFELRDAVDVDARNLAPDQPDNGVDVFLFMRCRQREGAALAPGAA